MTTIYQQDSFQLDAERITDEPHPIFGDMTVFHDVVIASEIVQQYNDGLALKTRDELEAYAWSVDGRWIMAGSHPADGIISERDQVAGRTVNPRYVKDLKDPKTGRTNRAGVKADVQVFNSKISPELLTDMRNGVKPDVSIGFFFSKDQTSGTVEDGTLKGLEFDYVQRNMFHDHLAVGIDAGRCPSPYCGLGADEIKQQVMGDPLADLLADVKTQNPDMSDESVAAICGSLKAKHEDNKAEDDDLIKAGKRLRLLLEEELETLRGENDAMKDNKEWWMSLDWTKDNLVDAFTELPTNIQTQLIDAGRCPTCGDEECPEGEEKNEEGKCVPKEKKEDVLESNPGFQPPNPHAEEECPEGHEWNAEKKQCVPIDGFSDRPENKSADKLSVSEKARRQLDKTDKVLS